MSRSNLISKFAEYNLDNPANFLKLTGAFGAFISCVCQTTALAINKSVPAKEKKFLIPQEITDGAINVSIYLVLASIFKGIGESLVDNAKILPKYLPESLRNPKEIKRLLEVENLPKDIAKFADPIKRHKKGMAVLTSIVGSVIAANIVTPLIRNKIAAQVQKKLAEERGSVVTQLPSVATNYLNPIFKSSEQKINKNIGMTDFLQMSKKASPQLMI